MTGLRLRWPLGAALASFALVGWITLRPMDAESDPVLRLCLVCGEQGVPNIVLNVLLYVPLGASLRLLGNATWRAVLPAVVLSAAVELSQIWIPGRHPGAVDFAANSLGALTGSVMAARSPLWLKPPPRLRKRLAVSWALCLGLWLGLYALAMRPSVPEGDLFAQWTPELGTLEAYEGLVLEARIGDQEVPNGQLHASGRVRELLGRAAPVQVRLIAGAPSASLAPVLRIVDGNGNEAFQLGIDVEDLVIRHRYRADDLKMARPYQRLPQALGTARPGDTILVAVETEPGGGYEVTVGRQAPVSLSVPAGRSWGLLRYPGGVPTAGLVGLDVLWTIGLFLPLGFWAGSRGEAARLTILPLVLLTTGPHLNAAVTGAGMSGLMALIGVALGWLLRAAAATTCGRSATASVPSGVR